MRRFFPVGLAIFCRLASLCAEETPACEQQTPEQCSLPKLQNCRNFNVLMGVQFIYVKYTTPLLIYGRDGVGLTNSAPVNEIDISKTGTAFSPNFKYEPGFRASLGVKFGPKKAFDLIGQYSWIQSHPKGSVSASDFSGSFLPLKWLVARDLASSTYQSASLKADLHFQFVELQAGYTFGINRYLVLRPYAALLSIISDGDLRVNYAFTVPAGLFETAKIHGECSSWSIGPKIGLDFSYYPTDNFSIYTNANFSHQACQISMNTKQTQNLPTLGQSFTIQKGSLDQLHSISIVGLEIGPAWDQWFCNNRYRLQLRATWQTATLAGTNLSFLDNNNTDIPVGAEFRGVNLRALFEF